MPGTNVPGFRGRFLAGARRGALDESFDYVFGRLPQPLRARVRMRHGQVAGGGPVTWLTIDPLESLGAGLSREAVMAAIGRRVRAEPVDASLCEREPIHIPGSIQPNAVMLAADAVTLEVLAYSANVSEIVDPVEPPLTGRPLAEVLPADFVETIRARLASGTLDDGRSVRHRLALPGCRQPLLRRRPRPCRPPHRRAGAGARLGRRFRDREPGRHRTRRRAAARGRDPGGGRPDRRPGDPCAHPVRGGAGLPLRCGLERRGGGRGQDARLVAQPARPAFPRLRYPRPGPRPLHQGQEPLRDRPRQRAGRAGGGARRPATARST